ncbi:MAG: hypothetical protein Q8O42_01965 [Acidobacteriota bacterium]|nr:hypothetical protein [Acidobacteriota bacterium]
MGAIFYSTDAQTFARLKAVHGRSELSVTDVTLGGVTFGFARANAGEDRQHVHALPQGGVLCSGLMLYDGTSGVEALSKFYRDFVTDTVSGTLSGGFTAAVVHDGKVSWITDPAGVSEVYVHADESSVSCANVLYFLASSVPALSLNEFGLIEKSFQYSTLGHDTLFTEILRVSALETLSIDPSAPRPVSARDVKLLRVTRPASTDSSPAALVAMLVEEYQQLDRIVSGFDINMTGGLDSRLQLALMLAAGIAREKIRLVHGVGSSLVTNTKAADRAIVAAVADRFGIEAVFRDWSDTDLSPNEWQRALDLAGEAGMVYGGNPRILRDYLEASRQGRFQVFGYFGELLRPLDWQVASNFATLDVSQFVGYYLYSNFNGFDPRYAGKFRAWMEEKVLGILGGDRSVTPEIVHDLFVRYRQSADTVMCRLCLLYGASYPSLGSNQFLRALATISTERKMYSSLMIEMIDLTAPELLEVDIFSHGAVYRYERTARKISHDVGPVEQVRRALSVFLYRFPRARHAIRAQYLRIFASSLGRRDDLAVERRLKAIAVDAQRDAATQLLNVEQFSGNHASLVGYAQYVRMVASSRERFSQMQSRQES